MIQPEIDQKYPNMFFTKKLLNIKKIKDGEKGSNGYYHKMQDWYLHDMEIMTGDSKGFTVDHGYFEFNVNGVGTVEKLIVTFNYYNSYTIKIGKYTGVSCLWFRKREKGSPKITASELKKIHKNDLILSFQKFITTAEKLGYLVDSMEVS